MNKDYPTSRIIRMRELIEKVGYARSTIYALIKDGRFPAPFRLAPNGRAIGWFEDTIDQWLRDRAALGHSQDQDQDRKVT